MSINFCLSVFTPAVAFPSKLADGILLYPYILAISSNISASSVISNLNVGTSNSKTSEDTKLHLNSKLSNMFMNWSIGTLTPNNLFILTGLTVTF